MKAEIESLIEKHLKWLRDKTVIRTVDTTWTEVTTPYLDRHNDYIQFYVRKSGNGYVLTDDGSTINDLISSGCALETPKRQELLRITLAGFGVALNDSRLEINATPDSFPLKKNNFLQAVLAVNDLFYTATPYVTNLFYEEVEKWLDLVDVRYTPKIKLVGKSGFDHMFDFVIPKSKLMPERVVQAINNPKKDTAENLVFKWIDTKEERLSNARLFALLNDTDTSIASSVLDAFANYGITPVFWSERDRSLQELSA